jgi:hypothetical protein
MYFFAVILTGCPERTEQRQKSLGAREIGFSRWSFIERWVRGLMVTRHLFNLATPWTSMLESESVALKYRGIILSETH